MQLYYSPLSPFVRKVLVLAHLADRADDLMLVPVSGNPSYPGTMPVDQNPLGKIPALILNDGSALYDSRVICRYLDAQFGTGLYPAPPHLWQSLTLEALGDGLMDASVLMRYETAVRAPEQCDPAWLEGQWAKVARGLDALETGWMDHLRGPLDIGVISVACALGYIDLRHADRAWRQGRADLAAWAAHMNDHPAMLATRPSV